MTTSNERVADPRPLAEDLETIAGGAGIGLLGFVIFAVLDTLFQVSLARLLGPTDVGVVALALSAVAIATVLALFGLQTTILRFLGIHAGQGDQRLAAGAIITGLCIVIIFSLLIGIILLGFTDSLATRVYQVPAVASRGRTMCGLPNRGLEAQRRVRHPWPACSWGASGPGRRRSG